MNNSQYPVARKSGLVIQELPDEVLVYDLDTNKAHCLNQTASKVWRSCDGKTSISEIAASFGNGSNEDLVWLAIDQLGENELLEKPVTSKFTGQSRRDVIKKIGLASIIAVPVIASLVAPQNALASASCACVTATNCAGTTCPSTTVCNGSGQCAPGPIAAPTSTTRRDSIKKK
jgi:hypothetical protein